VKDGHGMDLPAVLHSLMYMMIKLCIFLY